MSFRVGLTAILGAALLLAAVVACANGDETAEPSANAVGAMERATAAMEASAAMSERARQQTSGSASGSASGIWATGSASISVEPDLVLLTVGVESTAKTVAEARSDAAGAMDAIVRTVKDHGLEDKDIQTKSFNIWPQYEYPEVTTGGTRRQVLVGYTVSNTAVVKIRDVGAVGTIIDDVADAGGDATRIQGIDFSIEDTGPFTTQLREDAVKDAMEKAEHLASLAGVSVGDLVFISGVGAPGLETFAQEAMMMRAAAAPATSISQGQLELNLSVQAVFSIE